MLLCEACIHTTTRGGNGWICCKLLCLMVQWVRPPPPLISDLPVIFAKKVHLSKITRQHANTVRFITRGFWSCNLRRTWSSPALSVVARSWRQLQNGARGQRWPPCSLSWHTAPPHDKVLPARTGNDNIIIKTHSSIVHLPLKNCSSHTHTRTHTHTHTHTHHLDLGGLGWTVCHQEGHLCCYEEARWKRWVLSRDLNWGAFWDWPVNVHSSKPVNFKKIFFSSCSFDERRVRNGWCVQRDEDRYRKTRRLPKNGRKQKRAICAQNSKLTSAPE